MQEIIIDIHNIIKFYGYVSVAILKEAITMANADRLDVVGFTYEGKQYTNTLDETLNKIVADWKADAITKYNWNESDEQSFDKHIEEAFVRERRAELKNRLRELDNE